MDGSLLPLGDPTAGVTEATVSAWSLMVMMGHGGVGVLAENVGNGHYLLPMNFTMPGAWQVDITVQVGERRAVMSLMIPAFD